MNVILTQVGNNLAFQFGAHNNEMITPESWTVMMEAPNAKEKHRANLLAVTVRITKSIFLINLD